MNFGVLTLPLAEVEAAIKEALAPSVADDPCESLDDVMRDINEGRAQVWVASDGATIWGVTVTQVIGGSKARQCFIRHCAGSQVRGWIKFIRVIEDWARSEGCDTIELIGRPGWQRLLGWDRKAVLLRKALA